MLLTFTHGEMVIVAGSPTHEKMSHAVAAYLLHFVNASDDVYAVCVQSGSKVKLNLDVYIRTRVCGGVITVCEFVYDYSRENRAKRRATRVLISKQRRKRAG